MNDIPRVPVPPGSGRHRLPRRSAADAVPFSEGVGVPHPRDGAGYRGVADDGWDAAVMQELGPELAELWETAEQPYVAEGPQAPFHAVDPAFLPDGYFIPQADPAYPPYPQADRFFPAPDAVFSPADPVFAPTDAGYPYPGPAFDTAEHPYEPVERAYDTAERAYGAAEPVFPHPAEPAAADPDLVTDPEPDPDEDEDLPGRAPENWSWSRLLSGVSVLTTAVIAVAVAALGAVASYPSLRAIADGVAPADVATLWPLLIYGPWIAATLSILRARAYRRRTLHSWAVVIFFAAVAMLLCIAQVHPSPSGIAVAGLPPLTVLLCFHQFVRQLDHAIAPPAAARHAHSSRGQHRHRSAG
ncbi:DUF2637 domain-containing protein [Streptomyces sp. NPDC007100]|uniref:DUF2637 domain-containing protein n=1 Tax=Streptomyces sp. NPDC007100 TaxID=3155602 RepID=UPI003403C402